MTNFSVTTDRSNQVKGMVGIGITTQNRNKVFQKSLSNLLRFTPSDFCFAIVDDGSDNQIELEHHNQMGSCRKRWYRTHRFEKSVGIAAAKNKCFEMLEECEHIFLFDDDFYPVVHDWWKPYVESGEPHLMYIFEDFSTAQKVRDTAAVYNDGKIKAYSHARGVMCYFESKCLDYAGGMDTIFGKWGYEHPDLSNRIYNMGLTTWKYADVVGSEKLFYCLDEHQEVKSTVNGLARQSCINRNKTIYERRKHSKEFVPWKPGAVQNVPRETGEKRDVILTSYFTGVPDPQKVPRHTDPLQILMTISPLIATAIRHSRGNLHILHDCITNKPETYERDTERGTYYLTRADGIINPYFQRWASYRQFLITNRAAIGKVFCVDATDVEMLHDPFLLMEAGKLYTGDEPGTIGQSIWLKNHHKHPTLCNFMKVAARHPLLNAGLLGGDAETVLDFCGKMIDFYVQAEEDAKLKGYPNAGMTDMATFNFVAHTHFGRILSHGRHVNTVFKANERNDMSWWKHK